MNHRVLRDALLAELRETAHTRARARELATIGTEREAACTTRIDTLLDDLADHTEAAR